MASPTSIPQTLTVNVARFRRLIGDRASPRIMEALMKSAVGSSEEDSPPDETSLSLDASGETLIVELVRDARPPFPMRLVWDGKLTEPGIIIFTKLGVVDAMPAKVSPSLVIDENTTSPLALTMFSEFLAQHRDGYDRVLVDVHLPGTISNVCLVVKSNDESRGAFRDTRSVVRLSPSLP